MNDLSRQRCDIHPAREAVAICPRCRHYFCRECITEHQEQVLCARCLQQSASASDSKPDARGWLIQVVQLAAGTFVLWMLFYYLGRLLISMPSAFHEGTLWQLEWWRN